MDTDIRKRFEKIEGVIARERIVTQALLMTLINRELARSESAEEAAREIAEAAYLAIDAYNQTDSTPEAVMDLDRQRARDVLDALLTYARQLRSVRK